jgi:hypothetical protein
MGQPEEVLKKIVADYDSSPVWCFVYVVDALMNLARSKEATSLALDLFTQRNRLEDRMDLPMMYSIALRLTSLGRVSEGLIWAEWILNTAIRTEDEVMEMKALTICAIFSRYVPQANGSDYEAMLWSVIQRSRHNYERFVAAVAAEIGELSTTDRYINAVSHLSRVIQLEHWSVRGAIDMLKRTGLAYALGSKDRGEREVGLPILGVTCGAVDRLARQLKEIARRA